MDSNYPYNGRGSGPSGKPDLHFILKNSRADAEEAAKRAGRGKTNNFRRFLFKALFL